MSSTIHNAQTGEHITFLPDDDDALRMRFVIDGGGLVAAEHLHPEQEERFEVVTGTLRMRLNGQEREVHAGERIVVSAGVPHAWWNTSSAEPADVRIDLEPALESRAFFETLFQMVEDGHTKDGMPRNPVRLAVLAQRYHRGSAGRARRGGPAREAARSVLRGLIRVMALAGRVLGDEDWPSDASVPPSPPTFSPRHQTPSCRPCASRSLVAQQFRRPEAADQERCRSR